MFVVIEIFVDAGEEIQHTLVGKQILGVVFGQVGTPDLAEKGKGIGALIINNNRIFPVLREVRRTPPLALPEEIVIGFREVQFDGIHKDAILDKYFFCVFNGKYNIF